MGRSAAARLPGKKGRRKKPKGRWRNLPIKRIVIGFILFSMLLFSLGALGYMVFFRTVATNGQLSALSVWSDQRK